MNKKIIFFLLIVLIFLGILFRGFSLNNEISAEESDFIMPATAVANTGHPTFYHSESQPKETALWHPPMYILSLSLIIKLFSSNEIPIRFLNIFFSILTSGLIYLFCKNIIGKDRGKIIGLISSAFFMINYYIFSSSIMIDIDGFSAFFILGFIYFLLRNYQTKKKTYYYFAVVFLFFSIWNRYPIAFLVYTGIGVYYYFNSELKKYFKNYFMTGIYAFLGFISVWGFYSTVIEPGSFFSFISHNAKLGSEPVSNIGVYLGSFALNVVQFIRLFTFPAVILLMWSIIYFLKSKSKLIKILLIYSLGTLVLFFIVPRPAFGYSRYFMSIFPGLAILIGSFIYINLNNKVFGKKETYLVLASFASSLIILIILSPQLTIYSSNGLIKATNFPDFMINLLASVPIFFIFIFKKDKRKMLILVLIALILSYSLYFDIKNITYEPHIEEVAEYLIERTTEDSVIIVPKAIGYYAGRKFYINDNNRPELDFSKEYIWKYMVKSWENPEMTDSFFWPDGIYSGLYEPTPTEEKLEEVSYVVKYYMVKNLEYEKKIGEFYIYRL